MRRTALQGRAAACRPVWRRDRDCDSWPVRAFRGDRGFNLRGLMADQPKAGPGTREGRLAAFERRLQENRFAAMRRARELVRRPIQLSLTKSAGEPQPSDFRDKSAPGGAMPVSSLALAVAQTHDILPPSGFPRPGEAANPNLTRLRAPGSFRPQTWQAGFEARFRLPHSPLWPGSKLARVPKDNGAATAVWHQSHACV
jgi:hypothetical protein